MLSFSLLAAAGSYEELVRLQDQIRRSQEYREKGACSCSHCVRGMVAKMQTCVALFLSLCSTIFVVPMFKVCAKVFDCVDPLDGSPKYLADSRSTICYTSGHLH